jgi:HSP20 family molecular chaperone IbpA
MFEKKCKKCKEKLKRNFEFCPYCGFPQKKEDFGMLGRNDFSEEQTIPRNIFSGGFLTGMLGSAMKMLEREMEKAQKEAQKENLENIHTNFKLFINGKQIDPKNIKVKKMTSSKEEIPKKELKQKKQLKKMFDAPKRETFSKLKKETPRTNLRRLADSVIYEIEVPGVKKIEDISIAQIENTLEIKAISKNLGYFKVIETNYPLTNYYLEKEKLILELEISD